MKIKTTQEINVPTSPYCGKCLRKELDRRGRWFCTLFNRYLGAKEGNSFLKCFECYVALYDTIKKDYHF